VLLVSPSTTSSEFFDVAMPTTVDGGAEAQTMKRQRTFGVMTPWKVAKRITTAMRQGKSEIILSPGGKALVWLDRLCPPLADWLLTRFG
jgi:short-subunit dehydrogenase